MAAISLEVIVSQYEAWFRLGLLHHEVIKDSLLMVLHNTNSNKTYQGLPTDPAQLYNKLNSVTNRKKLKKLLNKGIMKQDQYDMIYSQGVSATYSSKYDVTMIVLLIRNCTNIPSPKMGWDEKCPPKSDESLAANAIRAREWRNIYHHTTPTCVVSKFNEVWSKGADIAIGLGYAGDITVLRSVSLDIGRKSILESLIVFLNKHVSELTNNVSAVMASHLDTKMQTEANTMSVIGMKRKLEDNSECIRDYINPTIHALQSSLNDLYDISNQRTDEIQAKLSLLVTSIEYIQKHMYNREFYLENEVYRNESYTEESLPTISTHSSYQDIASSSMDETLNLEEQAHDINIPLYGKKRIYFGSSSVLTYTNSDAYQTCKQLRLNLPGYVECITSGNKIKEQLSLGEYNTKCDTFVKEYFCWKDEEVITESIQFPPEYVFKNNVSKTATLFRDADLSVAITQYDTKAHLQFLGYPFNELSMTANLNSENDYKNRILVYNFRYNAIINVRYTDTTKSENVMEQLKLSDEDLQLFCLLHRDLICDSSICIISAVAAPNFNGNLPSDVESLVLSKKMLSTSKRVEKWIKSHIHSWPSREKISETTKQEVFMKILRSVFGFMSTRQLYNVPHLTSDTHQKIKMVMLTAEQLRILNSKEKKKIVLGGYGSGKTVVGQYHIPFIIESSQKKGVLYYICFDNNSLFTKRVRKFIDYLNLREQELIEVHCKRLTEMMNELHFEHAPNISHLLQALALRHQHECVQVHVIIDELDCELLHANQANDIRSVFEKYEVFHDSYVVFLPRSMEKHRKHCCNGVRISHEKYKYFQTGMAIMYLSKCMRATLDNFCLLRNAIKTIEKEKAVLYHPASVISSVAGLESELLEIHLNSQQSESGNMSSLEGGTESMTEDGINFKTSKSIMNSPGKIDAMSKVLSRECSEDSVKTETKFQFQCSSCVGHRINGQKPKLVVLRNTETSLPGGYYANLVKLMAVAMDKLCFDNKECARLILCNSLDEFELFIKAMFVLEQDYIVYGPYTNWKLIDQNNVELTDLPDKDYNLITNIDGARGGEAEEVIVCLNPKDEYERQLFIECVSRCTGNLFLVIPYAVELFCRSLHQSSFHWALQDILNLRSGNSEENSLDIVEFACVERSTDERLCTKVHYSKCSECYHVNTMAPRFLDLDDPQSCNMELYQVDESVDASLFCNLEPPATTAGLKCTFASSSSCLFSWEDRSGCCYYVESKCHGIKNEWKVEKDELYCTELLISGLISGKYMFRVTCINMVGCSMPAEILYEHSDICTGESYTNENDDTIVNEEMLKEQDDGASFSIDKNADVSPDDYYSVTSNFSDVEIDGNFPSPVDVMSPDSVTGSDDIDNFESSSDDVDDYLGTV